MEQYGEVLKYVFGGIVTLICSYFVNVWSKKNETDKDIKIAEINNDSKDYAKLKEDLHNALDSIRELKAALKKEELEKQVIIRKFDAVKLAFKIIFNQYAKQFQDDPDQLSMLEELKEIIEN